MSEVIEVENYIDVEWVRHLHLMCNAEFDVNKLEAPYVIPKGVQVEVTLEAGVHHLRSEWKAREAFLGTMRGDDRRERQIVLWAFERGKRVSENISKAAFMFRRAFIRMPDFAAVWRVPDNLLGCDVKVVGGSVILLECTDVPDGFVMVY